ncbi:MAG TPA: 16S rRNA (guanine(966)-N(2))-methyltransferase RsmD [Tissierellia bacterium]|nr:16S rRNA (guanine(966)-N(2))-methyltransferase RsmD [Tissierellia bacterium]
MRVISGINKGKKLYAPEGEYVRPTSDKVKEAVFNIIGPINDEALVLDIFAGSGSIGIEFLARGAKHCTFVDVSRKSLRYVKKNLEICNFEDRAEIILSDYEKAIKKLAENNRKFDYIFADPPYNLSSIPNIGKKVFQCNILKTGGLLIIESDKDEKVIDNINTNMVECKEKIYGRTKITMLKYLED